MYNEFYGFSEPPFTITPNSRYFFASAKHTEALSTLIYAIDQRKGFVVITGEIGSGKTTVCRTLINRLDKQTQTALITNTNLSGKDLLYTILEDLEVEFTPGSKAKLLSQLNAYLIEQIRDGQNVVLIIDEAQNLKPSVLEEVRMLSNLETETEKLIQIILMGQPDLKKKLGLSRLDQFRQRISVYYHIEPLNEADSRDYVLHRLKVAGAKDTSGYFTKEAMDLIYTFSQGVPRLINQICDSALLTGYAEDKKPVDEHIMLEVISESPMLQLAPNYPAKLKKLREQREARDAEQAGEQKESQASKKDEKILH